MFVCPVDFETYVLIRIITVIAILGFVAAGVILVEWVDRRTKKR